MEKEASLEDCYKLRYDIERYFDKKYEGAKFGGTVLVAKKDRVIFEKGYGMADYQRQIPINSHTRYDIASITKGFTALVIMQLREEGIVSIDDTVDKYIDNFPSGHRITIHQLLTHTSGLPSNCQKFKVGNFRPNRQGHNNQDKESNKLRLSSVPGTSFLYSNIGYILLGFIIEKVTGKEIGEVFKTNIFEKIAMNNTGFKDGDYTTYNLATGYEDWNKTKAGINPYDRDIGSRGGGGLCSNAIDLHLWSRALMNNKLISKESTEKIFTPLQNNYGYGWRVYKDEGCKTICEHSGVSIGFRSHIMISLEDEITAVVLSNFGDTDIKSISKSLKRLIE
jgi:CubicO group peptidase (beta-lactamase class C family)